MRARVTEATVTYAQAYPVKALSPVYVYDVYSGVYCSPIFNTLVRYNEKMEIVPDLATSWEVTDGPNGPNTRWIINLRQGVTWHDGWEFNATDVWFTWTSIMTPEVGVMGYSFLTSYFGSNESIKITGRYQLTVDLPKPNSYFLPSVMFHSGDSAHLGIIPWHILKDIPYTEWRTHTFNTGIGTYKVTKPDGTTYTARGPYRCMGFDPTLNKVSYELYEDYWDRENWNGNVKYFYQVYIGSDDAAIAALKTGEVDIIDGVFSIEKKVAEIEQWGTVQKVLRPRWNELAINNDHPIIGTGVETPLGKKDPARAAEAARYVRLAISYAIPRQEIINSIIIYGIPLATPLNPEMPGYKELPVHEYNITKAKEYMEKAGYVYEALPAQPQPWLNWAYLAGGLIAIVAICSVVFYFYKKRLKSSA